MSWRDEGGTRPAAGETTGRASAGIDSLRLESMAVAGMAVRAAVSSPAGRLAAGRTDGEHYGHQQNSGVQDSRHADLLIVQVTKNTEKRGPGECRHLVIGVAGKVRPLHNHYRLARS